MILRTLNGIILSHGRPEAVIVGRARGADTLSKAAALFNGIAVEGYGADWDTYGRAAGPIRNQQMLDEGQPTHLVAFTDTFDIWSGTVDMCTKADLDGIPMACLSNRDQVERWRAAGCPFGPFHAWSNKGHEEIGNV